MRIYHGAAIAAPGSEGVNSAGPSLELYIPMGKRVSGRSVLVYVQYKEDKHNTYLRTGPGHIETG